MRVQRSEPGAVAVQDMKSAVPKLCLLGERIFLLRRVEQPSEKYTETVVT